MKRFIVLLIGMTLLIAGCSQQSTKKQVYGEAWDGNPIIVKQLYDTGDSEIIHEIIDEATVEKLIDTLKSARWDENIEVDMPPPNFQFTYNGFQHNVWFNEKSGRVELTITDRSNYVLLSEKSSAIVIDILVGKTHP